MSFTTSIIHEIYNNFSGEVGSGDPLDILFIRPPDWQAAYRFHCDEVFSAGFLFLLDLDFLALCSLGFLGLLALCSLGFVLLGLWAPWALGPLGFGPLGLWAPWALEYCHSTWK